MSEILDLYTDYLRAAGVSDRTLDARVAGARRMLRLAGKCDPHQVTTIDAVRYIGSVRSRASRATYCQHVRAFARFLKLIGSPAADFADDIPVAKFPRGVPRPIDPNELAAALALAERDERTMLLLAAYAGLRVSEIGRVRGEDVSAGALYVRGKGGNGEMIPLHRLLAEAALLYPPTGYWFPGRDGGLDRTGVWWRMRQALDRVGSTATPHQVRHYYGTSLLDAGANIRIVQQLLRHASLNTTQVYTAVRPDDRAAAIAALPEVWRSA